MTRILVTGAAGMIGSELTPALEASNSEVWTTARQALARDRHIEADLQDPDSVRSLAAIEPDVVIHLAGSSGTDLDVLYRSNVLGTISLLESLSAGTGVLVAGSAAEYGDGRGEPLKESDALRPVSPYGWAKVAQTTVARAIAERRSLHITVFRPFNVVAPDLPVSTALGNMRRQIAPNAGVPTIDVVSGNLEVVRDYVPIDFVVASLAAIAEDPEPPQTVNICSGVGIRLGDILNAMGDLVGSRIRSQLDAALGAIASAPTVRGDPFLLNDRYRLSVEPTANELAKKVLGDIVSGLPRTDLERTANQGQLPSSG